MRHVESRGAFVSSYRLPAGSSTFAGMTPNQAIGSWIRQLAREFLVNRARDITRQGLLNTEELIRSLDAKTIVEPEQSRFAMIFFARIYGRWQDMRRRYTRVGGQEMIEDLEAWVEKEGVGKFTKKGRKNYDGIYRNKPKERVINRIAWGIIRKYREKGTAPKRGWYNRGKERDINTFYDLLLRVWREAVLEDQARKMAGN